MMLRKFHHQMSMQLILLALIPIVHLTVYKAGYIAVCQIMSFCGHLFFILVVERQCLPKHRY